MLWVEGVSGCKPMTVLIDGDEDAGPFWTFTSTETESALAVHGATKASLAFSSKGHDLFASIDGTVRIDTDPEVVDRLWNPFIAACYDGKHDPTLCLFLFDPSDVKAWIDASSLLAGVKMLFEADPKSEFQDKVGVFEV